jgi:hypothetical protein
MRRIWRLRGQRGAISIEYVGVLVFVVGLVLAVLATSPGIGQMVTSGLQRAVCAVTGEGCGVSEGGSGGPPAGGPGEAVGGSPAGGDPAGTPGGDPLGGDPPETLGGGATDPVSDQAPAEEEEEDGDDGDDGGGGGILGALGDVGGTLGDVGGGIVDGVAGGASAVWEGGGDVAGTLWEGGQAVAGGLWEGGKQAVGVVKGIGEGVWGMGEGLVQLGWGALNVSFKSGLLNALIDFEGFQQQWEQNIGFVDHVVHNPGDVVSGLWHGITDPIVEDWNNGNYGEAVGRGLVEVVGIFVGPKGANKLGAAGKIGTKADDVADLGRVDELGDAGRLDDAGDAGRLDDAGTPPVVTRRNASRVLAQSMENAGTARPPGTAAHHIVAFGDDRAADARAILDSFGIDINDASNGVFLPCRKTCQAQGMWHPSLHTETYHAEVFTRLRQATTPEEAMEILDAIREELLIGTFPR